MMYSLTQQLVRQDPGYWLLYALLRSDCTYRLILSWGRQAQAPGRIGVWRHGGDTPALALHTHMNICTYRQTDRQLLYLNKHATLIVSLNLLLILPRRYMLHSGTKDTQEFRPHDTIFLLSGVLTKAVMVSKSCWLAF